MKKDSDGMKNLAIVLALVVIVVIIVILLIKGCGVKEYTVSFDTNGGSAVNSLTIKEDGTISEPTAPTREGYIFEGWYYNDEKFDFSTKITKDMTLEARWRAVETSELTVDATSLNLTVGASKQVNVTLTGDLKDAKLVWKSSDEKIATVDSKGNIKALKEGEVTITVSTEDGKYSKTITVTVGAASEVAVTKVTISGSKEVEVGKTIKLTANIIPKNATNKSVTWKSSNTKIATVDKNGNVKGLKAGKVTITVTTKDGSKKASLTITVKEPAKDEPTVKPEEPSKDTPVKPEDKTVAVTGVTVNPTKLEMVVGESKSVKVEVTPTNATDKKLTWKSSDEKVAKVDANGKITAIGSGIATITVTVGGKSATITVIVKTQDEINMEKAKTSMNPKTINKAQDDVNYTSTGCTITPEELVNSSDGKTTVSNGIATKVYRNLSANNVKVKYTIKCGSLTETKEVTHNIPASPYKYTMEFNMLNIIQVNNGATNYYIVKNGKLTKSYYKDSIKGAYSAEYEHGALYNMTFRNDENTTYAVPEEN